jgi:hypothetical protein
MMPLATASPDVAQLSDAELVERIESALQSLETIEARKTSAWEHFRRFWGPRHPSLAAEPAARIYQALREIRDLTNELERRVDRDQDQRS